MRHTKNLFQPYYHPTKSQAPHSNFYPFLELFIRRLSAKGVSLLALMATPSKLKLFFSSNISRYFHDTETQKPLSMNSTD